MAVASFKAGETIAAGDAVYVSSSGFIYKASAQSFDQASVVGLALESGTAGAILRVDTDGVYASASGLSINAYQFLSIAASGSYVDYSTWQTELAAASSVVYLTTLGRATGSTTLSVEIEPPVSVLPPPAYLLLESSTPSAEDAILLEDGSPVYLETTVV